MIPSDEQLPPRRPWAWGWALLDANLIFLLLATGTSWIELPLHRAPDGVVARVTRAQYHPLTNYLKYTILAGGSFVAFVVAARRGTSLVSSLVSLLARAGRRVAPGRRWTALGVLAVAAFTVVLVNRTAVDPALPLTDTFHEGERLAFLPAVRASRTPLADIFLVHGLGLEVWPSRVAGRLGAPGHRIALTRVVLTIEHALGYLGALLAVVLAARLERSTTSWRPRVVAALASLVVLALIFRIEVKDTAYLLQLPLIMLFLAAARTGRRGITLLAAAAVGLSLPLAVLYVYDRAVYMFVLAVAMTVPLLALGRHVTTWWLAGVGVGVVLGLAGVVATEGTRGVAAIVEHISYWARYGPYINTKPLFGSSSCCTTPAIRDLVLLGTAILGQCLAVAFLARERERIGRLRGALAAHPPIAVLLIASVLFTRIAIERSDTPHFYAATVPSMLLLAVLVGTILTARFEGSRRVPAPLRSPGATVLPLMVAFALGLVAARAPVLNPVSLVRLLDPGSALSALRAWARHAGTPDLDILPTDDRAALIALGTEIRASPCFYTLTSEGTWYYLFDRPSCSRFHHVLYARTRAAQDEVIAALDRHRPTLILFSNNRDSNPIDGVSVFNANAAVARYVMTAYRPYRLVAGNHWFWRRAVEPYRVVDDPGGQLDPTPHVADAQRDLIVTGVLGVAPPAPDAAAVFVMLEPSHVPIWAGHTVQPWDRFRAEIPTASLPRGVNMLRVCLMTDPTGPLRPLGDVTIRVR